MTGALNVRRLGHRARVVRRRATWRLRMTLAGDHWMVMVAVLLALASMAIWVEILVPLRERVMDAQAVLDVKTQEKPLHEAKQLAGDKAPTASADGIARIPVAGSATWADGLAFVSERTAILDALYDAAPKHNLYLTQAQFRWTGKALPLPVRDPSVAPPESLQALEIVMPVKGAYKDIREFVSEVLEHNPSLALDVMDIARETPNGARLAVELRFTLYLRGVL